MQDLQQNHITSKSGNQILMLFIAKGYYRNFAEKLTHLQEYFLITH